MTARAERYRHFLENLSLEALAELPAHVTEDVRFKDPFNDLRGRNQMERVFRHMFKTLGEVRFIIRNCVEDGDACLMAWTFESRLFGRPWSFEGASVIRFAPDGRVAEHIDHWDAARDFYERLPVIRRLLGLIRKRVSQS